MESRKTTFEERIEIASYAEDELSDNEKLKLENKQLKAELKAQRI